MKIHLCSDLHLECGYQELPGGEVLILAGDICESRALKKEFHSTRLLDLKPGTYKWYDFFWHECVKYDRVYYVMGNHEHYGGRFDRTADELKSVLPENIRLLDDECEEYGGVLFIGGTLWTDLNKGNPMDVHTARFGMNDYRAIKVHNTANDTYHRLTPEITIKAHRNTKDYIRLMLNEKPQTPTVVITHHAPSTLSINERYSHDSLNSAYVSNLSELILDHPNIRYWVHGHLHDAVDYMIGSTRILSNPRGYNGYEDTSDFDPNFNFEV